MEHAPCAFCGRAGGAPVAVGIDRQHPLPGRFQVVRCDQCGLLRTDPRPTLQAIGRYYPDSYSPYTSQALGGRIGHRWTRWYPLGDKRQPVRPPGRLLEWGTGHGAFLARMQEDGWDVAGIEINAKMAAQAAARTGAAVQCTDVAAASFPAGSFDVICAWMVLEHLHDPVTALRRAHDWLAPGGTLCFSIPDAGSWMFRAFPQAWFCLDVPRHLYHFSIASIGMVLEACGFGPMTVTRPRTAYDLAHTLLIHADDRGWLSAPKARRMFEYLPVRAAMFGGGIAMGTLHQTSMLTISTRKLATPGSAPALD